MLRVRAASRNDTPAYTFLKDGQTPTEEVTLGELDRRARAIAALLQAHCNPGDRVLLVYPQSIEAIAAFLGCLYAGVVAIPAPAPEMTRLKRVLPRLEAIAVDAGATLVLTTTGVTRANNGLDFSARTVVKSWCDPRSEVLGDRPTLFLHQFLTGGHLATAAPHLTALPWLATDKFGDSLAMHWQPISPQGSDLAYLQYTSGSTSTPKGVMLDHDNLMGHLAALQQAGGYTAESVTVTWMPYFHDYGLVEGMLLPLYNGTPCYLMSPTAFIKRPLRWLAAISRYRATHSQAPNFAYAYCVRRIAPEDCADLDLSSWQAASIGAEPINPKVMDEFGAAFAGCGFQRRTFAPAYGLAEATLVVTMSRKGEEPKSVELADLSGRWVSCGRVLPGTQVEIVNPETGRRCGVDEVGEIWVASAGVARGYWQRQEETDATFGAVLADTGAGRFLRTGDLGFLRAGELFVTGRLKDLIIVRGENYYPQDIEWAVERCHPALRPDAGAALAVEADGEERVVVVWECEAKRVGSLEPEAILAAVRSTVAEQFELPMQAVVLLKRGSIFKTSSGKIQRRACRQGFLAGQLAELARWEMGQDEGLTVDRVEGSPLLVSVMEIWQQVLEVPTVRETDNFFELGGDSLKAAMLIAEIECRLRIYLPLSSLAQASTPQKLVELIRSQDEFKSPLIPIRTTGCKLPFFYIGGGSVGVEQLLSYLDPERPVYGFRAIDFHESSESLTTMEAVVQYYLDALLAGYPDRPYLLGGRCFGGNVALAMAGELKRRGKTVLLVTMADSHNPVWTEEQKQALTEHWQTKGSVDLRKKHKKMGLSHAMSDRLVKRLERHRTILKDYQPQQYSGRVVYFSAEENQELGLTRFDPMQPEGWKDWVTGEFEVVKVPGRHGTYHNPPHVEVYAWKLNACLEAIETQAF
ncbi:AMP-binding protein [Roseofilum acuticapitatum]